MLIKSYQFYSYVNIIIVKHAVIRSMHVLGVNCASAENPRKSNTDLSRRSMEISIYL